MHQLVNKRLLWENKCLWGTYFGDVTFQKLSKDFHKIHQTDDSYSMTADSLSFCQSNCKWVKLIPCGSNFSLFSANRILYIHPTAQVSNSVRQPEHYTFDMLPDPSTSSRSSHFWFTQRHHRHIPTVNFRFTPCIIIVNHFYYPTNALNYTKLRV